MNSKKFLVLYVPVIHQGYIELFRKYSQKVDGLLILGKDLIEELKHVEREIRAVEPEIIRSIIMSLKYFRKVEILDLNDVAKINGSDIVTVNEGISDRLAKKYFRDSKISFDTVFLRWDEKHVKTQSPVEYDNASYGNAFDDLVMNVAFEEAEKSSDWWRRVGAVLVRDGEIILQAHNEHMPTEISQYSFGDIRDFIKPGENVETASSIHAEKNLIALAALKGISADGASIYVTTFPCPDCAKVIAKSGIKKCYFSKGHSTFDGEKILKYHGVEILLI